MVSVFTLGNDATTGRIARHIVAGSEVGNRRAIRRRSAVDGTTRSRGIRHTRFLVAGEVITRFTF